MTTIADRLAWLATALAALAAAIGLLVPVYRDVPAMVDQAQGTDLATLFAAVPLLVAALWLARRGSSIGRVAAAGALGYLVYTYAIYAFQVVVSPVTPLHIAILGLAAWSLGLTVAASRAEVVALDAVGSTLPRRATAAFLLVVVVMFGGLWLSQIASAITSGILPTAVSDLALPTSAVYALDLAFALPVLALAAVLLLRRGPFAAPLALGGLVFVVLMALSILGLFGVQVARGSLADPSMIAVFGIVGLIGAGLAVRAVGGTSTARGTRARQAHAAR